MEKETFYVINTNLDRMDITINNPSGVLYMCRNIGTNKLGTYKITTAEYFEGGDEDKFYGYFNGDLKKYAPYVFFNIEFNKEVIKCPFVIYEFEGIITSIFAESHNWYQEQIIKLKEKYQEEKESSYKQNRHFYQKLGKISYDEIIDSEFLEFLFQKIPLKLSCSIIVDTEKSIIAITEVNFSWHKKDITNEIKTSIFLEYDDFKQKQFNEELEVFEKNKLKEISLKKHNTTSKIENEINDRKNIIYNHIKHLKDDNYLKEKIMSDEDFQKLYDDISYLVENNSLPHIDKPLKQIGVTNQSIIYTFRLIHKELFTTRAIRKSFIEFLEKYFLQLTNIENMKTAFSKKRPTNYPF